MLICITQTKRCLKNTRKNVWGRSHGNLQFVLWCTLRSTRCSPNQNRSPWLWSGCRGGPSNRAAALPNAKFPFQFPYHSPIGLKSSRPRAHPRAGIDRITDRCLDINYKKAKRRVRRLSPGGGQGRCGGLLGCPATTMTLHYDPLALESTVRERYIN
jgi:hypothetical protein